MASAAISAGAGFGGARLGAVAANRFMIPSNTIGSKAYGDFGRLGRSSDAISSGAGGTAGGLADILGQWLWNFFNPGTGGNGGPGGGNGGPGGGNGGPGGGNGGLGGGNGGGSGKSG